MSTKTHLTCPLLFVIVMLFFCSCSSGVKYRRGSLSEILEQAKEENRKVFVLVADSTCPRCKAFAEYLDTLPGVADAINKDFIPYKVYLSDPEQNVLAQILKVNALPFPYFLDSDGKILAFGFPNSKYFNVSDLDSIYIDPYKFQESFQLGISIEKYKEMVYYALQAYLEAEKIPQQKGTLQHAMELTRKSLEKGEYLYNFYQMYSFSRRMGLDEQATAYQVKIAHNYTGRDRFLYGPLMRKIGLPDDAYATSPKVNSDELFFENEELTADSVSAGKDLYFTFRFKNVSTHPVIIQRAEHHCDCIQLTWPEMPIAPSDTGSITGVFHTSEAGSYDKDIFVHMNTNASYKTIHLKGVVL